MLYGSVEFSCPDLSPLDLAGSSSDILESHGHPYGVAHEEAADLYLIGITRLQRQFDRTLQESGPPMKHTLSSLLFTLFVSVPGLAADISCRVVGISDGDTLTCLTSNSEQIKVRLAQIDAPEKDQAYGQRSKQELSSLIFNKFVTLQPETTDKYGRTVAKVIIDGQDVNLQQIRNGMAWVYTQYAKDPAYYAAEKSAQAARVGLWSDPAPVRPSDWRRKGQRIATTPSPTTLGSKQNCSQMTSCEEAKRYLAAGLRKLDRDGDGVPCEKLCK